MPKSDDQRAVLVLSRGVAGPANVAAGVSGETAPQRSGRLPPRWFFFRVGAGSDVSVSPTTASFARIAAQRMESDGFEPAIFREHIAYNVADDDPALYPRRDELVPAVVNDEAVTVPAAVQ